MGVIADTLDHTRQILEKDAEASCTVSRWKTLEMREWVVHLANWLSNSGFKRLLTRLATFRTLKSAWMKYSWQD